MESRKMFLPEMSRVELTATYVELDTDSPINQNEPHFHRECEIYINLSGDAAFQVENRVYPVTRGSVIVTMPFEYHQCAYRGGELHRYFQISFSADESDRTLGLFFDREKGNNNLIELSKAQLEECRELLNTQINRVNDALSRRIAFLRLIRILSDGEVRGTKIAAAELPEDVAVSLKYMDEHLHEELNVKRIAKMSNVSLNTLERHYKKALGMTPFAMLRKKRLFASTAALRNGDTVTDAALKSGFSDYSNYIQLFKKQFGMTPLQYKKSMKL